MTEKDLVTRLWEHSDWLVKPANVMEEAADALTNLAAEKAAVEKERDELKRLNSGHFQDRNALWDKLIPIRHRCRDCADCNGRCQDVGPPCDPQAHALERIEQCLSAEAERDTLASDNARMRKALGDCIAVIRKDLEGPAQVEAVLRRALALVPDYGDANDPELAALSSPPQGRERAMPTPDGDVQLPEYAVPSPSPTPQGTGGPTLPEPGKEVEAVSLASLSDDDLLAATLRARWAAHDAPLNPYRLDHKGREWVEPTTTAWAQSADEWMKLAAEVNRRGLAQPTPDWDGDSRRPTKKRVTPPGDKA